MIHVTQWDGEKGECSTKSVTEVEQKIGKKLKRGLQQKISARLTHDLNELLMNNKFLCRVFVLSAILPLIQPIFDLEDPMRDCISFLL